MKPELIQELFEKHGGVFMTPAPKIAKKLENIHGFLFDWDGVFNSGKKSSEFPSTYSETDSLGINLLRFSYWLRYKKIPFVGLVTNQITESAFDLAKREHYNAVYVNFKSKKEAFTHMNDTFNLRPTQVAFIMDDVLDLSAADVAGLSFMVGRKSSPLFMNYVHEKDLVDYISYQRGDLNAVRELCELMMGLTDTFEETIQQRVSVSDEFQAFLEERDEIESKFYHKVDRKIIETVI
ncbi:MAG: hypothetical protein AB7V36_07405 [Bacteroidales bacterium]